MNPDWTSTEMLNCSPALWPLTTSPVRANPEQWYSPGEESGTHGIHSDGDAGFSVFPHFIHSEPKAMSFGNFCIEGFVAWCYGLASPADDRPICRYVNQTAQNQTGTVGG